MLKVYPVLCRPGYMDNYAYILIDEETGVSAVIDPSEAKPVILEMERFNIKPSFILNTHHHFDHVEGNAEIVEKYGAKIVCNAADKHRIENCAITIHPNGNFVLGKSEAKIIDVSAHTQGHIVFYFEQDKILFTGDTLFNLCIGGLFEGTAQQMFEALQKIKALPDDVVFYPGHEYTMGGAKQAFYYNQGNDAIKAYLDRAKHRLDAGVPVAPVALGDEKACNPYLQAKTLEEFMSL